QKAEVRGQKAEVRGQKAEVRGQKAEGRRQKALLREWECVIPQAAIADITCSAAILRNFRLFNGLRALPIWHGSWYRVPTGKEQSTKAKSKEQSGKGRPDNRVEVRIGAGFRVQV
ncbi:MAG: hypothetical protein AABN33_14470, partial [Acidobacteriota bacterium]